MALSRPLEVPAPVTAAAEVIAGLDGCFAAGFGRLGPQQAEALQSLQRVFAGTPLESAIGSAVAAVGRSEFVETHFATLAAARAALQGAQHDALLAHARDILGRPAPAPTDPHPAVPTSPDAGPLAVWQESTRHWLMELALSGFKQLEYATLAPFTATLEQLQDEPKATRLAAILTGFLNELLQSMPIGAKASIPLFRWCDLWTRSMIAALRQPPEPAGEPVSGTFSPLGVDLRGHGYLVSADVYGLLETGGPSRVARMTISAYKVDVLTGPETWRCFEASWRPVLEAISRPATLEVKDCTLLPTGDLLSDGKLSKGKASDLWGAAGSLAPGASDVPEMPSLAAADRHPLHIAELICMEGYKVTNGKGYALDLGPGGSLPVATTRMSAASELRPDHVKNSDRMIGLLRFDGGAWSVQPLVVGQQGKKGSEVYTGSDAAANCAPKKGDTLAQLEERASRLLRKKA